MKVSNINGLYFNNVGYKKITFNGIEKTDSPCMFVYDLDGTLANGDKAQINDVLKISKKRNAKIIYATGRGFEEFKMLQNELALTGIRLKSPDFLVANNGENIYTNCDGQLCKNFEYSQFIKKNTNFNKTETDKKILSVNSELKKIESSSMTLKYTVPENINIRELKKNVLDKLLQDKIKVLCGYKGEGTDNQTLFIAPFNKSTAINYLKKHLNIPYTEILMAGNDNNDISMAKLSKLGAKFICLDNAKPNLIKVCKQLSNENTNIHFSISSGAKGILEGLLKFLNKV